MPRKCRITDHYFQITLCMSALRKNLNGINVNTGIITYSKTKFARKMRSPFGENAIVQKWHMQHLVFSYFQANDLRKVGFKFPFHILFLWSVVTFQTFLIRFLVSTAPFPRSKLILPGDLGGMTENVNFKANKILLVKFCQWPFLCQIINNSLGDCWL